MFHSIKSVVITLFMRDEAIKMYGESPLTIFETDFDLFRRRVLCDFLILDDTLEWVLIWKFDNIFSLLRGDFSLEEIRHTVTTLRSPKIHFSVAAIMNEVKMLINWRFLNSYPGFEMQSIEILIIIGISWVYLLFR